MKLGHISIRILIAYLLSFIASSAYAQATQPAVPVIPPPALSAPIPTEHGHFRLRMTSTLNGKPLNMCVVFSNSKTVAAIKGRVGALIFLCGIGERGDNGDGVFINGPSGEMQRQPALDSAIPMLIVSPQATAAFRWEDAGVADLVMQLVDLLKKDPRVDPDRIYLTGLSSGGRGVWYVAEKGGPAFAAISPISAMAYSPQTVVPQVKNVPIWMIVGGNDTRFTEGSRTMLAALRAAGANLSYTEVPGADHMIFNKVYPKLEYYQWFASHTRGKPASRKWTDEELLKYVTAPIYDPVGQKIESDFALFAPYWEIINCGHDADPGLHADYNGRKNIFFARPLNPTTPCLMQTTWRIPADKHAHLQIISAPDAKYAMKLIVRADTKEVLSKDLPPSAVANTWIQTTVDLAPWIGKDVPLEVFITPVNGQVTTACLAKLSVDLQ